MDTCNDLSKGFIVPRNPVTSLLLIPTLAIPILFVSIVYSLARFITGQGSKSGASPVAGALPEKKAA